MFLDNEIDVNVKESLAFTERNLICANIKRMESDKKYRRHYFRGICCCLYFKKPNQQEMMSRHFPRSIASSAADFLREGFVMS